MDKDNASIFERAMGLAPESPATDRGAAAKLGQDVEWVRKMTESALGQQPAGDLRARLLGAVNSSQPMQAFADRVAVFLDLPAEETRRVVELAARPADQWDEHPAPGIAIQPLDTSHRSDGCHAFLLHLAPGAELPSHGHSGAEWGLMLQGQVADDLGATEAAGDLIFHDERHQHRVWNSGTLPAVAVNLLEGRLRWV